MPSSKKIRLIYDFYENDYGFEQETKINDFATEQFIDFEKGIPELVNLEAKMDTLIILEGRKNKMRPGDILGALTGEAGGLKSEDIGKIEIHDFFAYVAVSKNLAKTALMRLQTGRIKGRKVRVEWPKSGV